MIACSRALYASTSAIALLASGALSPVLAIDVASRLSPAGLGQPSAPGGGGNAGAAGIATIANPALQAQIALSSANLAKAAQAIKDMNAAQAAARATSQLTLNGVKLSGKLAGSAWTGAVLSGLKPVDEGDPTLWVNAEGLQKDAGAATATVKQTAANALLNWQSFDLEKGETLVFDQQDHSDWTVLNRIVAGPRDPVTGSRAVASPTRILGKIEAPGSVYVINPNGIIFGATAEINVHSLIASSLDVGNAAMSLAERDNFFLNTGILGSGSAIPVASFSYDARDKKVEGDVKVEAGAIINTSLAPRSVSPDAGGFVYLFAPSVENDGSIVTPAGETMLVAAQTVRLTPNAYPDGGISLDSDDHQKQTFRGVGFETSLDPSVWRQDGDPGALISAPGSAINNGLIDAERGVVILNGDYVANGASGQNSGAVIRANTSITRNGEIFLDARLQLTLNGGIQILPAENGETIPKSAIGNFKPGSIEMRGQTVDLEPGALVVAPGASVSITSFVGNHGIYPGPVADSIPPTAARIYMAPGASIDVSGLNGVTLPMSANLVSFKPFGNEFADQPLQRDGALRGLELTVDIRETGSRDGVAWIGTPLANVSGFANTVPQTLEQLLTTGGNVSFSAPSGNAILRQGSTINVGGGYVQYEAGVVNTSKLLTADGRIVDIARADPLETYVGVAGVSLDTHPKWGVTNSFVNPLVGGGTFQPSYTEGHDAGGVTLNAQNYALDGTFYAGAVAGERQRLNGRRPDSANANTIKADPNAMPSAGYFSLTGLNNLIVSESLTPLPAAFSLNDELPVNRTDNARLAASALTDANFAHVSANFIGHIDVSEDALLKVAPGGTISLTGGSVDIEGQLTARSGAIFIEATAHIVGDSLNAKDTSFKPVQPSADGFFDLTIGPRAVLDASGLWVNDANTAPEDFVGAAFIDGGTVRLTTDSRSAICASLLCKQIPGLGTDAIVDLTGSIVLSAGSFIDVSSGGRVTDHGVIQLDSNGRPAGNGGNVALQTYQGSSFATTAPLNPTLPLTARIVLQASDGTPDGNAQALNQAISARGFGHGGALSIETLGIEIGGSGSGAADVLSLPESFFAGNAFGSYDLAAVSGGIVLAPDVTLRLQQSNFLASDDLLPLPTGAHVSQFAGTGTLPDILRAPVDLALSAALPPLPLAPYDPAIVVAPAQVAIRIGEGAAIEGDPGADIRIHVAGRDAFTPATGFDFTAAIAQQIGVAEILGSIRAPGGTIALSGAANSEIWLGATSRLDVSGVVIADARQPSFRTGEILSGGTVTIVTTGQNASVVAEHGAVIDVSGAAGTFDLLRDPMANGLDGEQRVATALWSDAGTIAITTATLLYDGSFAAHAGAESGRGGTLIIAVPDLLVGREEITVLQGGEMVPEGLQPTDDLAKILAEKFHDRLDADTLKNDGSLQKLWDFVFFQADRLIGSGISDLTLSASPTAGDTVGASQGKFAPGRINFQGDVTIGGLTNLALDASGISITDASGHLLATDVPPAGAAACDVCLDASYVALRGAGGLAPNNNFLPQEGGGILRIAGDTIDVAAGGFNVPGGAGLLSFSGIAHTTLVSTGDIRLRVPLANVTLDLTPGTLPAGEVITAGDLTLQAAQIYPISSVDITLKSLATDGTIAFGATGNPVAAPLSAGGQVTVSAAHIVQGGRLLAPLGTIQLGAQGADDLSPNDPAPNLIFSSASQDTNAARPTKTVTFTAGSTTSVSLAGQVVPFGRTANGTSWSYDSSNGQPLTAPPEKNLLVSGAAIDVAAGATLDVTGGGDIRAMEFVPGIGGTRDVLANGSNVYAIIPGYDPAAAPLDLDFILPKSILNIAQPGDAVPLAGSRVFLSGAPGLPAGYYTLLPAHYATLPGAYRVSVVANSRDALASTNNVLPDGTLRTAGFFAEPGAGTRDAQSQFFDVQSSAVWRQYSEIDQTTGNTFFGPKTVGISALPPPLPADAGHAVFNAVSGLNLDGILRASPAVLAATGNIKTGSVIIKNLSTEAIRQLYLNQAVAGPGISPGAKIIEIGVDSIAISEPATADTASESLTFSGRGAKFDIAARDIEVLSPGSAARNDQILPLDVTQLSGLGAESLLIGGVRSMGSEGEIISVVANAVEIHNDATMPLQAPEIILVAKAGAADGDINAGLNVRLDAGSVVRAVGTVSDPTPRTLTIENAVAEDALAGTRANGALLAVSNGGPLTVLRPKAQTNGTITIIGDDAVPGISGARIEGASLTLDTSGIIRLNSGATVQADDISVSARGINFGAVTGAPGGFIVADDILAQFQQAETLTLRSGANGINFYGDVDLTLARAGSLLVLDSGTLAAPVAGSVIVKAGAVVLRNSGDSPASKNAVVGKGVLQVAGSTVEIGSGDKLLSGFATVNFAASEEIAVRELGSMTVLADLAFQTPRFLVGSGANQSVTVAGAVRFGGTGDGIPVATPEIGGTLNVAGTSI